MAVDCLSIVPQLISLEPILGAAIGINLAYLNLRKFEYIRQVRKVIKIKLDRLDPNVKNQVKDTKWYKQLDGMASLDLDEDLPMPRKSWWLDAPSAWGFLYNVLFYWPVARFISVIALIYCIYLMILAVAHDSKSTDLFACAYYQGGIGTSFTMVSLSLVWPVLAIGAGTFINSRANAFVNYQTDQLKAEATNDAEAALSEIEDTLKGSKAK